MPLEISDSWMVQILRITAFPVAGISVADPSSWWENTIGSVPDSTTIKPKEGLVQSNGKIDETAQLTFSFLPDRIDWQLSPVNEVDSLDNLVIGDFVATLPMFVDIVNRWLERSCPEIRRFAFGAVLVKQVTDRVSGYSEMAKFLPAVQIDAEGSADFYYSINRPRASTLKIEGLTINRLSKWGVAVFKAFKLPTLGSEVTHAINKETYLCRLELDINTADNLAALPKERIPEIFTELINLGKEIAERGDVK